MDNSLDVELQVLAEDGTIVFTIVLDVTSLIAKHLIGVAPYQVRPDLGGTYQGNKDHPFTVNVTLMDHKQGEISSCPVYIAAKRKSGVKAK